MKAGRDGIAEGMNDEDVCRKGHGAHVVAGHVDDDGIERAGVEEKAELCQKHPGKGGRQVGSGQGDHGGRYAADEAPAGDQQIAVGPPSLISSHRASRRPGCR